jgi:hypothetical protein
MKTMMKAPLPLFLTVLCATAVAAKAEDLPQTLLAIRGKLLVSEDFAKPLAPLEGKPIGFASGFTGWRYNPGPGTGKSGRWELAGGEFKGIESPDAHHPATASFGFKFKDAIIQCDVRLNDVPDEGRKYRSLFVKATDAKDYVISLSVGLGGLFLTPYSAERLNPTTKQRDYEPVTKMLKPIKLGEWHTVVLEIEGDEVVGTLDGRSATCSNPLIGVEKDSIMFGAATEASFRHFRVWEALPNPDWPKHKAALAAAPTAAPTAK